MPRTTARTPTRAYPRARAPHPPACNLRVVVLRVAVDVGDARCAFGQQPPMARVQVSLVDRPVRMSGNGLRIALHRAPEVRDKMVLVVYSFCLANCRTRQQNGAGTEERLDVVDRMAEPLPNNIGNCRLATKPRERSAKLSAVVSRPHGVDSDCVRLGSVVCSVAGHWFMLTLGLRCGHLTGVQIAAVLMPQALPLRARSATELLFAS